MQVMLEIPEDLAATFTSDGRDPARSALEGLAIESYRSGALSASQTRRLLGFTTRYELDGFLKDHQVMEHAYSVEDFAEDIRTNRLMDDELSAAK